jgi:hypothetical protein
MMLHHRSFSRWKERHQCKFDIKTWGSRGKERCRVTLKRPPAYSDRIQSSKCGNHWHFPMADSDKWLCICRETTGGSEGGSEVKSEGAAAGEASSSS